MSEQKHGGMTVDHIWGVHEKDRRPAMEQSSTGCADSGIARGQIYFSYTLH